MCGDAAALKIERPVVYPHLLLHNANEYSVITQARSSAPDDADLASGGGEGRLIPQLLYVRAVSPHCKSPTPRDLPDRA